MNCVLHIGIEKTGTTSLQEFFVLNQESLLSQNYKITHSLGKNFQKEIDNDFNLRNLKEVQIKNIFMILLKMKS